MTASVLAACATSSEPSGGGGIDAGRDVDATFGEDGGSDSSPGVEASMEASVVDSGTEDSSVVEAAVDSSMVDSAAVDSGVDAGTVDSSTGLDAPASDAAEGGSIVGFGAATTISVGDDFACTLTGTGAVVCWGDDSEGELGNDAGGGAAFVPVQTFGFGSGALSVSAGAEDSTCAVTAGGSVMCWGVDNEGQLGNGTTSSKPSLVPVQVTGLTSGVTQVSAGAYSACAVTAGGGVMCWGEGGAGQLGNGSSTTSSVPVQVVGLTSGVASVTVGQSFACALTTGGGVMCWGENPSGELGNNTTTPSNVPVQVTGLTSGVTAVSAGAALACAIETGGAVVCWGSGIYGGLGNGTNDVGLVPGQVTGLTSGVTSVSAGNFNACAVTAGGSVMCWGYNGYGGLGDNSVTNSNLPVQVMGLTSGATAVSAGGAMTCAVVSCGVQCWGSGDLGNDASASSEVPVVVDSLGASPCP
jgi:hypothetical protein